MEKVRNFMLLYNLEKETMLKVISKSKIMVYKPNEILFYQNSTPLYLYLVLSGEISFKKYSNTDLLTMIGSEENIILSKKYFDIKYLDTKMSLPFLHKLRDTAFHNFQEVSYKKIFTCGDVIGDENLIFSDDEEENEENDKGAKEENIEIDTKPMEQIFEIVLNNKIEIKESAVSQEKIRKKNNKKIKWVKYYI